ncbi:ATP-binding protein [Poseidonibacter antarcticus]|uniref:ATP-binding protein n=1 Tax=Poseidonibacter antarcticus TaxID=2478538 RepID=UPI000EF43C8C|nr:ATP-binding protein [Poseidonibacter antarcticus]
MELVYLWVEDYKNIHKQGFNFSPRFECEFKDEYDDEGKLKDNCELIIKEKKDYVSIFPDNINVTAIVGENGSGKSSILELLPYGPKSTINDNIVFLLFYKNEEYILLNLNTKKHIIILNNNYEKVNYTLYADIDNIEKKYELRTIIYDTDFAKENFKDKDILKFFDDLTNYGFSFKKEYLENNNKIFNIEKYKHISNFLIYILRDELISLNVFFRPIYMKISNLDMSNSNLKIDEIIESLTNEEIDIDIINKLKEKKDLFIKLKYNQKIFVNNLDEIKIFFELAIQEYLDIDFYNEKDISFSEFSQGERNFYNHFLLLMYINKNHSKSKGKENAFFLIDEPDTTLHPNWQKKYVNQLLNIYKNYKKDIHLIITSHSPFILSDLPKENVIFLEKGKQVYPFEDNQQTFGANIHTLLSHGFFMKDGLMGEFAKNKISKILNFLNGKNKFIDIPINQIKPIIKIIGEDFLREKLLRMYDERFPISKEEKIKQLEEELKKLRND